MIKSFAVLGVFTGTAFLADIHLLPGRPAAEASGVPPRDIDSTRAARPRANDRTPLRYGLLWLDVEPGDAQVSLDGNFLDVDVWLISMAPGRHAVSIRKDGFLPVDRSIGIAPGENLRLALHLEKDSLHVPSTAVPGTLPKGIAPSGWALPPSYFVPTP